MKNFAVLKIVKPVKQPDKATPNGTIVGVKVAWKQHREFLVLIVAVETVDNECTSVSTAVETVDELGRCLPTTTK